MDFSEYVRHLTTRHICGDCGVLEGQIHEFGCDMERCPFCGNQLIICQCIYEKLGIDCSEGTKIYEKGPTLEQENKWIEILNEKGRVPFIRWPNICGYCGCLFPEMFRVSDEDWKKYIQIKERKKMVCKHCFELIKYMTDHPNESIKIPATNVRFRI